MNLIIACVISFIVGGGFGVTCLALIMAGYKDADEKKVWRSAESVLRQLPAEPTVKGGRAYEIY